MQSRQYNVQLTVCGIGERTKRLLHRLYLVERCCEQHHRSMMNARIRWSLENTGGRGRLGGLLLITFDAIPLTRTDAGGWGVGCRDPFGKSNKLAIVERDGVASGNDTARVIITPISCLDALALQDGHEELLPVDVDALLEIDGGQSGPLSLGVLDEILRRRTIL